MKTLWDLIQAWKSARSEAERIEVHAQKARKHVNDLEIRLRDVLVEHGPALACNELYLPPDDPSNPVRVLPVADAMNVVLSKEETEKPKGGAE